MTEQPLSQTVAARLKQAREYLGMSQKQVADALGMHRPTISEIEMGNRRVTVDDLVAFSRIYSRPINWLLGTSDTYTSDQLELLMAAMSLGDTDRDELRKFADMLHCRAVVRRGREASTGDEP